MVDLAREHAARGPRRREPLAESGMRQILSSAYSPLVAYVVGCSWVALPSLHPSIHSFIFQHHSPSSPSLFIIHQHTSSLIITQHHSSSTIHHHPRSCPVPHTHVTPSSVLHLCWCSAVHEPRCQRRPDETHRAACPWACMDGCMHGWWCYGWMDG